MRFNQLTVHKDGEHAVMTSSKVIEQYLAVSPFHWLTKCEMDDAVMEIKDNVLYWKSGVLYWGNLQFVVFDGGEFRSGTWNSGIFINGTIDNVKIMNGVFKSSKYMGEWVNGQQVK